MHEGTTFTEEMRAACGAIWAAQLAHPFVVALADGSLPQEAFRFYILQDARFLTCLAQTFAFAATKTDDHDRIVWLAEHCQSSVRVERALHEQYAAHFGMSVAEMSSVPMAPTNYAYTRHLREIGATGTLVETVTAMLPCAWIYAIVGQHFTARGEPPADHPYRDWLATYAAPGFEEVGQWMRDLINDEAPRLDDAERGRLHEIFHTGSQYEYAFWDMAWRREAWPVQ